MKKTTLILFITLWVVATLGAGTAWADRSAVAIQVPPTAPPGAEITIKLTVTHSANSAFHYTNWLWVKVNGREIGRWDYTSNNRPEGATFTTEIKWTMDGDANIEAKANCNLHGSKGETTAKVSVQK